MVLHSHLLLLHTTKRMAASRIVKDVRIHLLELARHPEKPLRPELLDKIDSLAIGMHDQAELF